MGIFIKFFWIYQTISMQKENDNRTPGFIASLVPHHLEELQDTLRDDAVHARKRLVHEEPLRLGAQHSNTNGLRLQLPSTAYATDHVTPFLSSAKTKLNCQTYNTMLLRRFWKCQRIVAESSFHVSKKVASIILWLKVVKKKMDLLLLWKKIHCVIVFESFIVLPNR